MNQTVRPGEQAEFRCQVVMLAATYKFTWKIEIFEWNNKYTKDIILKRVINSFVSDCLLVNLCYIDFKIAFDMCLHGRKENLIMDFKEFR